VNIVETFELTKHYSSGKVKALESCNLAVEKGKIFGLLGPNGAGKTTLVKMLLGIVIPTKGSAKILGKSIEDYMAHQNVGYLAENHRFPEFLTASQILFYYGRMSGLSKTELDVKIPALLKQVNLADWMNTKIHKYSKGMAQRLGLAHALLNDPQLIFLDEPTDGIDPVGRREIRDLLIQLRDQGKTIFLNSHLLSEVARISDEVAILKNGHVLQTGRVEDFISVDQQYFIQVQNGKTSFPDLCKSLNIPANIIEDKYTVSVQDDAHLNKLIDELRRKDTLIKSIVPRKISLEDYFIDVIEEGDKQ
jgi:ABC-2 type transport system ATP-binding protein